MGKVFRRAAFGGFNKKEVIEYLERLNQEQKVREADAAEEIHLLEKQMGELKAQLRASEEREARQREDAQQHIRERDARAAALQAELAETREGLDATLSEQALLRQAVAQLRDEKTALIQEKLALSEEKNQLSSRILDFDDERRVFEAERQRAEQEMLEQRRELESRIFDLEAEVLEGLEKKDSPPERSGEAFARRIAEMLAQPPGTNPPAETPAGSPAAPEQAPAEDHGAVQPAKKPGGRVVVRRPGQAPQERPDAAQPEPPQPPTPAQQKPPKDSGKLASVRDILRHVRKR